MDLFFLVEMESCNDLMAYLIQEKHVENAMEISIHLKCVYHMQAWRNRNGGLNIIIILS